MRGVRTHQGKAQFLRPFVRAADGIVHNRQRKRMIHRYRRVNCVALVTEHERDPLALRTGE